MRPQLELDGARAAHAVLLDHLATLTDAQAVQPSRLPGWSVGHVVTHLARNADAMTVMFLAANAGAIADQYPGGLPQRAADIEAGATRDAATLVADVSDAVRRLEDVWATTDERAWATGIGRTATAGERPLDDLVFRRWRETEVHHVDMGLTFTWQDWSEPYVDLELDRTIGALTPRLAPGTSLRLEATGQIGAWLLDIAVAERVTVRAPKHELLAWLLGRHDRADWPTLAPW